MQLNPPRSDTLEKAILSIALTSADLAEEILDTLTPEDFFFPKYNLIFRALKKLRKQGKPLSAHTLTDELKNRNLLQKAGGTASVTEIATTGADPRHTESYIRILKNKTTARSLHASLSQALEDLQKNTPVAETIGRIQDALTVTAQRSEGLKATGAKELAHRVSATLGTPPNAIPTGITRLDKVIHGIIPGKVTLIGGRPAMGKTSLAVSVTVNTLKRRTPVFFFSIEMDETEIATRLLSQITRMDPKALRDPNAKDKLQEAIRILEQSPLTLYTPPTLSAPELRAEARKIARDTSLGLIVVDYLQLMTDGRSEKREEEVASISRTLVAAARETGLAFLALSQLNRKPDARQDRRPTLADLRSSGALEQDAHTVILIHGDEQDKEQTTLIVAKNRNGPTADIPVTFHPETTTFSE